MASPCPKGIRYIFARRFVRSGVARSSFCRVHSPSRAHDRARPGGYGTRSRGPSGPGWVGHSAEPSASSTWEPQPSLE